MEYILFSFFVPLILFLLIRKVGTSDKNKKKLAKKLFIYGFLSTLPIAAIEILTEYLNVFNGSILGIFIETFITIAFIEELGKYLIVKKHVFPNNLSVNISEVPTVSLNNFANTFDMIVFSASAALGFSALENILFISSSLGSTDKADIIFVFILRIVFSIPLHLSCGIIMGKYIGKAKLLESCQNIKSAKKYKFLSVFLPTLWHGLYDFGLFANGLYFISFLTGFILDIIAIKIFIKEYKTRKQIVHSNEIDENIGG